MKEEKRELNNIKKGKGKGKGRDNNYAKNTTESHST